MLRSLCIKNFRMLEDFQVQKLGRVNLIVGRNNSGKSSVLEALRIFAGNANRALLLNIAEEHDEKSKMTGNELNDAGALIPFDAFFTGRRHKDDEQSAIVIGETLDGPDTLHIKHGYVVETEETQIDAEGDPITTVIRRPVEKSQLTSVSEENVSQALFVTKGDKAFRIRFDIPASRMKFTSEIPGRLPCSVVPTQFVTVEELAEEWDKIVLTEHQETVKRALNILSSDFADIAFVKHPGSPSSRNSADRLAIVRLSSHADPVPLNSMGDGMLRVLQLALKVFSAENGILLIDEFENGLHYSVQSKVWDLLFELAEKLDVQVFATTHSWDCIESFAYTAAQKADVPATLFRMGKSVRASDAGRIIATVFDESQLINITQADVEVR